MPGFRYLLFISVVVSKPAMQATKVITRDGVVEKIQLPGTLGASMHFSWFFNSFGHR